LQLILDFPPSPHNLYFVLPVGDIDPDLGIKHAEAIAQRLAATANTEQFPSLILSSPFRRCAHTAHIIATKLSSGSRKAISVCIEEVSV
jgi:phosphohistidine phosphatase SixA